jgi:hypothetical protein
MFDVVLSIFKKSVLLTFSKPPPHEPISSLGTPPKRCLM